MDERQKKWKILEERIILLFEAEIKLMDDIARFIKINYLERKKRRSPLRELCLGYLLISRANAQATLLLIEANLVHQVNYISRNTCEMVVNLYYIDDDQSKREDLTKRYFEYHSVKAYQTMKTINDFPDDFSGITTPEQDKKIKEDYANFIAKYTVSGKKPNINTWSGKNLKEMITAISNSEMRDALLKNYKFVTRMNNNFLHPGIQSQRAAIRNYLKVDIDYIIRVMHLNSIHTFTGLIIKKLLEHFSKGRLEFVKRLDKINKAHDSISESVREQGLLSA